MNGNGVHLLVAARPRAGSEEAFSQWASRLQKGALAFQGSRSCEIWPPTPPDQEEWVAVMRFESLDALRNWRVSENHRALIAEAQPLVEGARVIELTGSAATEFYVQNSATEVIVTEVKPGKENDYREWANRIDKLESGFPGFRGSYMQPPASGETAWTTLLRFDTIEKLNAWLESPARAALVKDAEELVDRVVAHRVEHVVSRLGSAQSGHRKAAQRLEDRRARAAWALPGRDARAEVPNAAPARARRAGHLHRQRDQRRRDDVAADAGRDQSLSRLALP